MNWRQLVQSGVDFCFPSACPGCEKVLPAVQGDSSETQPSSVQLCLDCISRIAPPIPFACERCGAPVGEYVETADGCGLCSQTRFLFSEIVRLGVHQNHLRSIVIQGKEPGGQILTAALARLLFEREESRIRAFAPDFIVPVPRFWTKTVFQPQNAPLTMANLMAHLLKRPVRPKCLSMPESRQKQSVLSPTERKTNLKGAFKAKPRKALKNARILLVDDVLTTGSTANEAIRALQEAGTGEVMLAVLSRGVGHY